MSFVETSIVTVSYTNKDLANATKKIRKIGNDIKENWFKIASIVADVDSKECYKDDGFNSVHEWVEQAFNLKKSASYTLLAIGKDYVREICDVKGRVIGYGSNLVDSGDDFSKTQVEKLLPLGHDVAVELVEDGKISPYMTVKEISKVIDEYKAELESDDIEPVDEESVDETDVNSEIVSNDKYVIRVFDDDGAEVLRYEIPVDVWATLDINAYKVNF